jgi:hypothetical protein
LPASERELNLALISFPYWHDYSIDVDVYYTRDDKDDYCGVVILAQDEKNYLYFSLGARNQRVEWWMRVNNELKLVPETRQESVLKDDVVYHVRIEVSGGGVVTFLDNTEIARFGTQVFDSGLAGLFAYSEGASHENLCAFDNLLVLPLEP